MQLNSQASIEGILHAIKDEISMGFPKERLIKDIDSLVKVLRQQTWNDPDYYYDRKGQIVKKINNEYVDKNSLTSK